MNDIYPCMRRNHSYLRIISVDVISEPDTENGTIYQMYVAKMRLCIACGFCVRY